MKGRTLSRKTFDYEFAPVGFMTIDRQGTILQLNRTAADMLQRPGEYLVGQNFSILVYPKDLPLYFDTIKRVVADTGHSQDSVHMRLSRSDGSPFYIRLEIGARFDEKGHVDSMHFVVIDIIKRKQVERALIESERKYSVVFNRSPYAISLASIRNDVIIDINQAWSDLFGFTREEAVGKTIAELGIIRDRRERVQILDEFQHKGFVRNRETTAYRTKSDDNPVLIVDLEMVEIEGEGYVYTSAQDITERKNMEEALRKAHDEMELRIRERTAELVEANEALQREIEERSKIEKELIVKSEKILQEQNRRKYLSKKLVEILEKERQDMAATLHDEVGQILTTIAADIDFVKEIIDVGVPVPTAEIEKIQDRIRASMAHVGNLSRELRPHILDNLGLLPALRNMLDEITKSSRVECRLFTKNISEHLKGEKALTVYRIIQEALTNCVRHARAQNIDVTLTRKKHLILLTIEDDGVGFKYNEAAAGKKGRERLGIIIMNERAVQADGEFYIESRIGKGTRVIARIPFDKGAIKSRPAAADVKIGEAS